MPYVKPANQRQATRHMYISNAGPIHGVGVDDIRRAFEPFCSSSSSSSRSDSDGSLLISTGGPNAHFWHISFTGPDGVSAAAAAMEGLAGQPCAALQGRKLHCKYASWVPDEHSSPEEVQLLGDGSRQQRRSSSPPRVALTTADAAIPGLTLLPDFVSPEEEAALLAHIDGGAWSHLAKRRVQHYGFRFEYSQRGVDLRQQVGTLPDWSADVVARMQELPGVPVLDQLTVNEYTPGVGIAPHVDAHSSFTGAILALSLAGGATMVFRRGYSPSTNPDRIHLPHVQDSLAAQQRLRARKQQQAGQGQAQAQEQGQAQTQEQEQQEEHGQQRDDSQQQQQQGQEQQQQGDQVQVYLPPRSLLLMSGECRYGWQHYIPHRKSDLVNGQLLPRAERRVSLTFRKVRGYPCTCSYPESCDSQDGVLPPPRTATLAQQQQQQHEQQQQQHEQQDQQAQEQDHHHHQHQQQQQPSGCNGHAGDDAAGSRGAAAAAAAAAAPPPPPPDGPSARAPELQLEEVHVHQVYDAIASHFSSTRFAVWPKVRAFLEGLAPGSVVADVGCGNGKYLGVRPDVAVLGCDRSPGLAAVAGQRLAARGVSAGGAGRGQAPAPPGADVLVGDAMHLPYRPGSLDAVLCIAVLHHISSRQRRVRLLEQLAAVLRPGGHCLVTVWATQQEDPGKTIQRWHKIRAGTLPGQQGQLQQGQEQLQGLHTQELPPPPQQQQQQHRHVGQEAEGPDYLVPWHLPFHRAGALGAANLQLQPAAAGALTEASGVAAVRLDAAKGAIVLQRYYHLFEEGELEGLVCCVPGLSVLDSFYDRSNWCVVCEKCG